MDEHTHPTPEPQPLTRAEARIFRRSAAPVQGGRAHQAEWVLEFEPTRHPDIEPLMGWIASDDVLQQVRMSFADLASAETYCRREGIPYSVTLPAPRRRPLRSYADNFAVFEGGAKPIYPH